MNKTEFVKHIRNELDFNESEAKKLVDSFIKCLTTALPKQDEILLTGFGRFTKKHIKEGKGRNPQTGQEITIAAYNQIRFKPGQQLRDAVNK